MNGSNTAPLFLPVFREKMQQSTSSLLSYIVVLIKFHMCRHEMMFVVVLLYDVEVVGRTEMVFITS